MRLCLRGERRRLEKSWKAETRSWGGHKNHVADTNTYSKDGVWSGETPASTSSLHIHMHACAYEAKHACVSPHMQVLLHKRRKKGSGEQKEQEERNKEQMRVCVVA